MLYVTAMWQLWSVKKIAELQSPVTLRGADQQEAERCPGFAFGTDVTDVESQQSPVTIVTLVPKGRDCQHSPHTPPSQAALIPTMVMHMGNCYCICCCHQFRISSLAESASLIS